MRGGAKKYHYNANYCDVELLYLLFLLHADAGCEPIDIEHIRPHATLQIGNQNILYMTCANSDNEILSLLQSHGQKIKLILWGIPSCLSTSETWGFWTLGTICNLSLGLGLVEMSMTSACGWGCWRALVGDADFWRDWECWSLLPLCPFYVFLVPSLLTLHLERSCSAL